MFSKAKWITTEDFSLLKYRDVLRMQLGGEEIPENKELQNYHAVFEKEFIAEKGEKFTINITADDYYKLYINGSYIGQGPAQGYYFSYYWNSFDITDFLNIGENKIKVEVFYSGLVNRAFNSADNSMGMIAEIRTPEKCVLATDNTWTYYIDNRRKSLNILGASTLFTEDIDNTEQPSVSKNCVEAVTALSFSPDAVTPLQVYKKYPAEKIQLNENYTVYDFGQEICGSVVISAIGQANEKVKIYFGEELADNGEVRFEMRCNCRCENVWTLNGGHNLYEQYDYLGFHYLGIDGDVQIEDVYANVRHFPFDDDYCKLETENDNLKKVWKLCKNTIKYATQEMFLDCPQREKGQYAGDLTITSAAHLILTGNAELLKKAIDNQMQSAQYVPSLLAVTPGSLVQEIADYSFQFPILALRYYSFSGDKDFLRENLKICEGIIDAYKPYVGETGLLQNISDKWNLVDWPHNLRDNYDFPLDPLGTAPHNVINAFYIGCVLLTEQIREILGIDTVKKSEKLIIAFNNEFYDKDRKVYTDCLESSHASLHSNIIPAFFGFNPPDSIDSIKQLIIEKGMCCGVYMAYFMLKALCNLGGYREALNLIISDGENSWMNMVKEGATTCFEAWGKDKKWNTSLCHPWATAPISVLAEDILPNLPTVGKIVLSR